jgi:BirA family biotin operon repressor/biotin-[acetyl-CoA-carboxylase] ligase
MKELPRIDHIMQQEANNILCSLAVLKTAYVYEELTSTNDQAHLLEKENCLNGTIILASRQTHGRGRLNRSWHMAEGDIALSIILRPPYLPLEQTLLTMMPAVSLIKALNSLGVPARLKWPNDIIIAGNDEQKDLGYFLHFRKVGGILIENVFRQEQQKASILGIGINVTSKSSLALKVPHVGSLLDIAPDLNRQVVLRQFLSAFDEMLQSINTPGFSKDVYHQFVKYCETLGRNVSVTQGDQYVYGKATEIKYDGSLIIDDGEIIHQIVAGDVLASS